MKVLHRILCAIGISGHKWVAPPQPEWPDTPDFSKPADWVRWEIEMSMHRARSLSFIGTPDSCGVCGVERIPLWMRLSGRVA